MPKNGLPIVTALRDMLSYKPINVSRGKAFNLLQKTISCLSKIRNNLKHRLGNRDDFVKDKCIELRNKVQLATEEAIQQINKFNEQLIDQIDQMI